MPSHDPSMPPNSARSRFRAVRVAFAVAAWFSAILRVRAHRREVRALLGQSERELRDIGLTRSDVLRALHAPTGADPSVVLLVRCVSNRGRDRALALSRRELTPAATATAGVAA